MSFTLIYKSYSMRLCVCVRVCVCVVYVSVPEEESWYPKEKLKQVEKKLLGYNPAFVMRCVTHTLVKVS